MSDLATKSRQGVPSAFTLVELLVAMAVMGLLLTMVLQIVSQTSAWAKEGTQKMNATREAQTALDALANDLSTLFNDNLSGVISGRTTVDGVSNSTIAFLSRARPRRDVTDSRLTALFYSVKSVSDPELGVGDKVPMLCRDYGSIPWTGTSGAALSQSPRVALSQAAQATSTNALLTQQVAARGVFRFEVVYVLSDGTITANPPARTPAQNLTPAIPVGAVDIDLHKVRAIIVAVIALDDQSRRLLLSRSAQGLADYAAAFPSVGANQSPAETWSHVVIPNNLAPSSVRAATCIAQKTINLH